MKRSLLVFASVSFILGLVVLTLSSSAVIARTFPEFPDFPDFPQVNLVFKKYIVVLKDTVSDSEGAATELSRTHGFEFEQVFKNVIKGFSVSMPEIVFAKLKEDPRVEFISEDFEVHTFWHRTSQQLVAQAQSIPTGISRVNATSNTNKGTGIGVAVIDTGIYLSHSDLSANIVANKNCVNTRKSGNDDNGHGSHVAGTIAALDNSVGVVGVAPAAKLIAVKVLNSSGSGYWSQIICGLDWVVANTGKYNIKVANLSLGGGGTSDNNCGNSNNDALHRAICRARDAGVTIVVAAGNSSADAANTVPAAYDDAVITVSALADSDGQPTGGGSVTSYGADDTFAGFSNFGSPVDIAAPGVNIYSAYKNGGYTTMSGTSMATPHVAGAAALYLQSNPGAGWLQVRDALKAVPPAEALGSGHTDPSGVHPEPVLQAASL